MTHLKVSVILSIYNQAEYLQTAINSILNQSFINFELLIIDDASTDKTPVILRRFKDRRIKIFTNRHRQGLALSLNQAIRKSRGQYLARMDADDIAHKDRLQIQVGFFDTHPQVAVCGTAVNLVDAFGHNIRIKRYPTTSRQIRSVMLRYNPLIHPTVMVRKSILQKLGNYDSNLNGAEDYDLWLRIASRYKLVNLDKVLLDYRVNPQGISWQSLKNTELQAIKARIKALKYYSYPQWQSIYLIKPILGYLIPSWVKKLLFNIK